MIGGLFLEKSLVLENVEEAWRSVGHGGHARCHLGGEGVDGLFRVAEVVVLMHDAVVVGEGVQWIVDRLVAVFHENKFARQARLERWLLIRHADGESETREGVFRQLEEIDDGLHVVVDAAEDDTAEPH